MEGLLAISECLCQSAGAEGMDSSRRLTHVLCYVSHRLHIRKRRMPTNLPSTRYLERSNLQYLRVTFYVSPSLQNGLRYPYLSPPTRHFQYEALHQHP